MALRVTHPVLPQAVGLVRGLGIDPSTGGSRALVVGIHVTDMHRQPSVRCCATSGRAHLVLGRDRVQPHRLIAEELRRR